MCNRPSAPARAVSVMTCVRAPRVVDECSHIYVRFHARTIAPERLRVPVVLDVASSPPACTARFWLSRKKNLTVVPRQLYYPNQHGGFSYSPGLG